MNLKITNSPIDFAIYYLSRFLEKDPPSFFKKSAENFGIDIKSLKELNLDKKDINNFIMGSTIPSLKENLDYLLKKFSPASSSSLEILTHSFNKEVSLLKDFLENLLGAPSDLNDIEIALIPTFLTPRENFLNFPASVHENIPRKIFLIIHHEDKLEDSDTLLMYLKTFFHEFSHVFLNTNKKFSDTLKEEWLKNYKEIEPREYRKRIKELIVSSLFYYKDFGFAYPVLGWEEKLINKEESLKKNIYRKITFDFLEKLKTSKSENKLEKLLPDFIAELNERGLFLE